MKPHESPATRFLCDLHCGRFSKAHLRAKVMAKEYPGLRMDWAAEWVRLSGIG